MISVYDVKRKKQYDGPELYHPPSSQYFAGGQHAMDILKSLDGVLTVRREPVTEGQTHGAPQQIGSEWVFPAVDLPGPTAEEVAAAKAEKIEQLWQAATRHEETYISGSARSLLVLGVLQGLPKCIAVQNWVGAIWTDYYNRKAIIQGGGDANDDFSDHGPIPHSVPELRQEVGL